MFRFPLSFNKLYLTALHYIQENYGIQRSYDGAKIPILSPCLQRILAEDCLKFGETNMATILLQNPTPELALPYLRLVVENSDKLTYCFPVVRLLLRFLLENRPAPEELSALPAKFWDDLWSILANYDPVFPDELLWENQPEAQLEFLALVQGLTFDCTPLFLFQRPLDPVAELVLLPQIREPALYCRVQAELQRNHPELFSSRLP